MPQNNEVLEKFRRFCDSEGISGVQLAAQALRSGFFHSPYSSNPSILLDINPNDPTSVQLGPWKTGDPARAVVKVINTEEHELFHVEVTIRVGGNIKLWVPLGGAFGPEYSTQKKIINSILPGEFADLSWSLESTGPGEGSISASVEAYYFRMENWTKTTSNSVEILPTE